MTLNQAFDHSQAEPIIDDAAELHAANRLKQIKLNCRRGNAEAETLLMPYTNVLKNDEMALFESLVGENDQTLFYWLMNPVMAPQKFQSLIYQIRTHYLTVGD